MRDLPILRDSQAIYMEEINRIPLLSRDEEMKLAYQWYDDKEVGAAHKLITANLRFVVKIANEYKRYGMKLRDLIQEGNIGLMMAVKKFDPNKGYRLISYAVWWIRAYIQNFVMRTWSLVKVGTTQAQKKLFFKLREAKKKMRDQNSEASVRQLSEKLEVKDSEFIEMELRLAGRDFSIDSKIDQTSNLTHGEILVDTSESQEAHFSRKEERALLKKEIQNTLSRLNEREQYILKNRLMAENPESLQEIGEKMSISRERVRQIEVATKNKMRKFLAPAFDESLG